MILVRGKPNLAKSGGLNFRKYTPLIRSVEELFAISVNVDFCCGKVIEICAFILKVSTYGSNTANIQSMNAAAGSYNQDCDQLLSRSTESNQKMPWITLDE